MTTAQFHEVDRIAAKHGPVTHVHCRHGVLSVTMQKLNERGKLVPHRVLAMAPDGHVFANEKVEAPTPAGVDGIDHGLLRVA